MSIPNLSNTALPFLGYLDTWQSELKSVPLKEYIENPGEAAIVSVDVTNGFCYEGPLASPRVKKIVAPIVNLFQQAWDFGVRWILFPHDAHDPDAKEFSQWAPHCISGTTEAEPVTEIKALPFFEYIVDMPKNSIDSAINSGLPEWIEAHKEINTFIVVGDCTDLCTYQLAMYLRLDANARQIERRVILPADCCDTFDIPLEAAKQLGIMPHLGDLMHAVFLYHMALNGIEVIHSFI